MAVNTSEQIVREAADIEAYKIGLLQSAKALADQGIQLPPQMVAEMSSLQLKAGELAEAGIGQYQPYLDAAAGTLGDAQNVTGSALVPAQAMQTDAAGMFRTAEQGIAGQVGAAQQGIGNAIDYGQASTETAQQGLGQAALNTQQIAGQSMADQLAAYDAIPGQIGAAQKGMAGAATGAQGVADAARVGGTGVQGTLAENLAGATKGARTYGQAGIGAYEDAVTGSQQAVKGARNITSDAAAALQQAGAFGQQTAEQGIAGLAGTTGAYDPASTGAFMNQYEDAAVQQALADIQRAGDIQQQGVDAQAVSSGAFGGSRQAVAQSELGRNILEQQGRTAAGMRQAGFENAANRSQQAFEAQQGRGQQAAQLTGALGAQGAGSAISAAQGAGQLGLSAEQLAAGQAGQLGQLGLSSAQVGMSAEQQAAANAQALAQTGMSLEQLAASTGMSASQLAGQMANQSGALGLSGAQAQAGIAAQAGQMGMAGEQFAGQMAGQAGQLGQGQAQMGMQGAQAAGSLGLQGQEMTGRIAEGLGSLGSQAGQLGLQQGSALKDIAMSQGQMGEANQAMAQKEQGFLFDMGKQYQAQDQAGIEAARQTQLQQAYEPYQRVGFLSDIYKGAPSSQSTITATTTPNVSPAQSILGLGVAGLAAASGARNAGIF